jgi:hypothetical protein
VNSGGACSGVDGPCSVTNTCTGAVTQCCGAGTHCSSGSNTCKVDRNCAFYGANHNIGDVCSNVASSAFPDGPNNNNLICDCALVPNTPNNKCEGSSPTTAGTCICAKNTATNCGQNGQNDGCGAPMSFLCGTNQRCNVNTCCNLTVCPGGLGVKDDPCGDISECGATTHCNACSTAGGWTNMVCGSNNRCTCTLDTCHGRVGVFPDGCGSNLNCES